MNYCLFFNKLTKSQISKSHDMNLLHLKVKQIVNFIGC